MFMNMINNIIGTPLGYIMRWCWLLANNYGAAIILFTLLTRLITFPLSVWVQKNSIKMIRIKPALNQIAAKYADDGDRAAQEQFALYKQEGYKPLAGIVPLCIRIPVLMGVICVIYNPLQHLLHLDAGLIDGMLQKTMEILRVAELGNAGPIKAIELIKDPAYAAQFFSLQIPGIEQAVADIQALNLHFLGFDLTHTPTLLSMDKYLLLPVLSALSSFALCVCQNKVNVLQREQKWLGRWGMAIFLTLFSLYFGMVVPTGVGLYWIVGNVLAIIALYLVNWIYKPSSYIDYEALEESKQALERSKQREKAARPSKEQKRRAKVDYKKFLDENNKKRLVFYSEKSGFYKYYAGIIDELLQRSELVIHYVTSDPNDAIFSSAKLSLTNAAGEPRIVPYYIDDNRLIVLFMKMDADMVIMTTPDLQQFHLKRSLVRKDVEYVYVPHGVGGSFNINLRTGALDYYDTVFLTNEQGKRELRALEALRATPEKRLVEVGFPLMDEMLGDFEAMEAAPENARKRMVIAPSWQPENIMESCIETILDALLGQGYFLVVRPHPQYVRHHMNDIERLKDKYAGVSEEELCFETDFSSSFNVYAADVLITDWSNVGYEFSFTTCKPALFIHTPMKIMNAEYEKIAIPTFAERVRPAIGCELMPEEIAPHIAKQIAQLLEHAGEYSETIDRIRREERYHFGCAAPAGADYIIEQLVR